MLKLHAITYTKSLGEYMIERRDVSGHRDVTFANTLTDEEVEFAKSCNNKFETKFMIAWFN